ncbi:MAG: transporter ATP-binding protein, partial [Devosia sp.]|nr:transporter ATP-binding protein [Devosia sp.]
KRFYRRLLEDYMTEERTLIITTHQVDEIEFMLSDIMLIRDGSMILHMQMETVNDKFTQLVVNDPAKQAPARALGPVYEETRFGQTVMIFDGVPRSQLEGLGNISTPTLSDLFVALMQRPTANPETAK